VAKKVTAIIAGVSWAVFGLSHLFAGPTGALSDAGVVLFVTGILVGIGALIALAVLALIDYARRPR
jgi:hypothetical protein